MHYTAPNSPAGMILSSGPVGTPAESETYQCPHCGGHWQPTKGSGKPHVWCGPCHAWTCSTVTCLKGCYPIEKRLADSERAGRLILPV